MDWSIIIGAGTTLIGSWLTYQIARKQNKSTDFSLLLQNKDTEIQLRIAESQKKDERIATLEKQLEEERAKVRDVNSADDFDQIFSSLNEIIARLRKSLVETNAFQVELEEENSRLENELRKHNALSTKPFPRDLSTLQRVLLYQT